MRLTAQILFFTLLPLLIVLGNNFYQSLKLENILNEKLKNNINNINKQILYNIDEKIKTTKKVAKLLSNSHLIVESIENRDVDFLYNRSKNFIKTNMISNIIFLDNKGIVLSRGNNEFLFNDSIEDTELFKIFKKAKKHTELIKFDNKYQYITFYPIYKFDVNIIGYVIVGQIINKNFINSLEGDDYKLEFTIKNENINSFTDDFIDDLDKYTKIDINKLISIYINISQEKQSILDIKSKQTKIIITLLILSALFVIIFVRKILKPFNQLNNNLLGFTNNKTSLETLIKSIDEIKDSNNELNQLKQSIFLSLKSLQKTQKKLIESNKNANHAHKLKSDFLSNMSYQIRTPMNEIIGFIGILKDTKLNEKQDTYINKIVNSTQILIDVVNNILDISKIEAGNLKINYKHSSLKNCFKNIKQNYQEKILHNNLDFIIKIDDKFEKYKFKIDSDRLCQALENIIDNAIKFTNNGFVKIEAKINDMKDNYCDLTINIQDSGIGIEQKDQEIIFESFAQVFKKNDLHKIYHGTGLGLSVSKQIIKLMGGDIIVKSKKNKGSTFTINLYNIKYRD